MRLLILLACLFAWVMPVKADYQESRAWFGSLPASKRIELQANLILLGYYNAFADGEFGRGTYGAITAFQKASKVIETGILSESQLSRIADRATKRFIEWGIDVVEDKASESTFLAPLALLTEQADADGGTVFATPDQGLMVQTFRIPTEVSPYASLYAEMTRVNRDHSIGYKAFAEDRFVVAGNDSGVELLRIGLPSGASQHWLLRSLEGHLEDQWHYRRHLSGLTFCADQLPCGALADPGATANTGRSESPKNGQPQVSGGPDRR